MNVGSQRTAVENQIARLLDWRHLPGYRLELRIDPFVARFLARAVGSIRSETLLGFVLPELPLRRGSLNPSVKKSPNKSTKVDFTLFSRDRRRVIFVELKTDDAQRRPEQDKYLETARQLGWRGILEGVLTLSTVTDRAYVLKYDKLLQVLWRLGYIEYAPPAPESPIAEYKRAMRSARVSALADDVTVKVLFVQPTSARDNEIGFSQLAKAIRAIDDPLAPVVAAALDEIRNPAGSVLGNLLEDI